MISTPAEQSEKRKLVFISVHRRAIHTHEAFVYGVAAITGLVELY